MLSLPVRSRCSARSTRRSWKYDSGVLPNTLRRRRASVRLLAPTATAAFGLRATRFDQQIARRQRRKRRAAAAAADDAQR